MVEQLIRNQQVVGSIPTTSSRCSVCFTAYRVFCLPPHRIPKGSKIRKSPLFAHFPKTHFMCRLRIMRDRHKSVTVFNYFPRIASIGRLEAILRTGINDAAAATITLTASSRTICLIPKFRTVMRIPQFFRII